MQIYLVHQLLNCSCVYWKPRPVLNSKIRPINHNNLISYIFCLIIEVVVTHGYQYFQIEINQLFSSLSSTKIKKIIIFQEIELSSSKIKKVIFLEMVLFSLMFFLYFRKKISKLDKWKKMQFGKQNFIFSKKCFSYISENGTFLP